LLSSTRQNLAVFQLARALKPFICSHTRAYRQKKPAGDSRHILTKSLIDCLNKNQLNSRKMAECGAQVSSLLSTYRDQIDTVLSSVQEYVREQADEGLAAAAKAYPLDELAVLKFVLSAQRKKGKTVEHAVKNLITTLEFRKNSKALLDEAGRTKELKFYLPGVSGGFLGDFLVNIYYAGQADMNMIATKLGNYENALNSGIFLTEQIRIMLDQRTRETGRLCKLLAVVDLSGLSLRKSCNRTMMAAMGAISKHNEVHSPQVLAKHVVINAPSMVSVFLSMLKPFLSESTWEKLGWCKKRHGDGDISNCPFVSSFAKASASIPKEYGGTFVSSSETAIVAES
jgi:hypothetical protein